jgi:hypothetical protein
VSLSPIADFTFLKDVYRQANGSTPPVTLAVRALIAFIALLSCVRGSGCDPLRSTAAIPTITTPHFTIYFLYQMKTPAHRLAVIAEDVANKVSAQLGRLNGRVHVILVNQHDSSNGWATPRPYNTIEISTAVPPGESTIGNADDWLRLVLSYDITAHRSSDKARMDRRARNVRLVTRHCFIRTCSCRSGRSRNRHLQREPSHLLTNPAGDFRLIVDRAAGAGR